MIVLKFFSPKKSCFNFKSFPPRVHSILCLNHNFLIVIMFIIAKGCITLCRFRTFLYFFPSFSLWSFNSSVSHGGKSWSSGHSIRSGKRGANSRLEERFESM